MRLFCFLSMKQMNNKNNDTIFAPSTAIGGAIAVIRISGPRTKDIISELTKKKLSPNVMSYTLIKYQDKILDNGMMCYFQAPISYTGEDMLEIHCHGGIQTIRSITDALIQIGLRPAEGGEFTRRAFLNGKMDLTQAEAVMDLINAQAESSMRSALNQLNGGLSKQIQAIESSLLDILSGIEAAIDYPDEVEDDVYADMPDLIQKLKTRITELIETGRSGRFLRDGIKVVIIGKPNVGKSSLFNALLGQKRAIVTSNAGTTRDILDEYISINGIPVRLMDTAGLRKAEDEAESIGINMAKDALKYADLLLLVLDGSGPLTDEDMSLIDETAGLPRILISNKSDLGKLDSDISISCLTQDGINQLKEMIVLKVGAGNITTGLTNIRHIRALQRAMESICHSEEQIDLDCKATDLREALHEIGTITGNDVDDKLLDRVFENFCVGK